MVLQMENLVIETLATCIRIKDYMTCMPALYSLRTYVPSSSVILIVTVPVEN